MESQGLERRSGNLLQPTAERQLGSDVLKANERQRNNAYAGY